MKLRAWNSFCLFSLLMFVFSVAIWVRSYFVAESINRKTWGGQNAVYYDIQFNSGAVEAYRYAEVDPFINRSGGWGWSYRRNGPAPRGTPSSLPAGRVNLAFLGIELQYWTRPPGQGGDNYQSVTLPLWIFLPSAIPPILWWRQRRRRDQRGFPVDVTKKDLNHQAHQEHQEISD